MSNDRQFHHAARHTGQRESFLGVNGDVNACCSGDSERNAGSIAVCDSIVGRDGAKRKDIVCVYEFAICLP